MEIGISRLLSALALLVVMTQPAQAERHGSVDIISFDAPGADTTANDYSGTFPTAINAWGVVFPRVPPLAFTRSLNGKLCRTSPWWEETIARVVQEIARTTASFDRDPVVIATKPLLLSGFRAAATNDIPKLPDYR